ncbi:Regulatory protein, LuxR:Response regulator receiver [Cupriavidus taiwanensis]|uniref:Regulatory protein, LuxR:Response regulator receiver n=1 Tax=Cupriavidus taiwanensis TaxID=164546 RepID=A0A976B0G7_9BURK|nr:response regulator transcription factor [Cupriavidus taiwanensis]SOZ64449.1 Regulatory protein, LuxR:Response regulator receiver [Cupriavidus taiwanensis]SOZ65154.1 Regulatory protein, LuxR:Response regulator receiver [Cupriavidus taiwanensis]SOZ68812.1 Regulatory protein, LuxR:Response regulator receiver [Cupriavidus taiwanensis]SPA08244.1 Regulatory protein, LuxR:Response regulator receiver [Cupriavidus taiwanensis]
MAIRVILADDHPLILFGVRQSLAQANGISVVADASNPRGLMEKLQSPGCDVLVTDFYMPGTNGPDGLVMLNSTRLRFPRVRVVVLTTLENLGLVKSMRTAGVLAVVNKRDDLTELPSAIMAAFKGRPYLSTSLQRQMDENDLEAPAKGQPATALSPREMEVVRLYVSGLSTTAVAKRLHRSVNTISTQKHSAMRKLGLVSDTELYAYAIEHGLFA